MKITHKWLFGCCIVVVSGLLLGLFLKMPPASKTMSIAVSSDGQYAVTAHRDNGYYLWNLQEHTRTKITDDANIYSAAFVSGRHAFLWQNLDGETIVQNVEGSELKRFKVPVNTYGHLMTTDLTTYYFSDIGWGIYRRDKNETVTTLKEPDGKAFLGYHTILNLKMAEEAGLLLSVGDGLPGYDELPIYSFKQQATQGFARLNGLTLWDLKSGKPAARLGGNAVKTHATISPDGQWVVSGDENGIGLFWNTEPPFKRQRLADYHSGVFLDPSPDKIEDSPDWDRSQLIDAPKGVTDTTIANAFIYKNEYFLRFGNNSHKAGLFKAGNPWPQKYFDLGKSPVLVTYGSQYSRNTAIATSPEAGVLVMGHKSDGGLSVYQFDARTKTLERTWVVD